MAATLVLHLANWGDILEPTNNGYEVLQKQLKAETLTLILVLRLRSLKESRNDIKGIIRYEGASQADPTTEQWSSITNSCGGEPYASLVPYVRKGVGNADSQKNLNIGWFYETDLRRPTDLLIYRNQSVFPSDYNIHEIAADKTWTYWVIQDLAFVNAYHPFHLHRHDFYILAHDPGLYTPVTKLNRKNPPRRDTAKRLVLGISSLHSRTAIRALQFVDHQSEIPELVASVSADFESTCAKWDTYYKSSLRKQDVSGA
ncbi:hypothetical protein N7489_007223 [Penicillium chrysogenum]|uniref:Plastocyanin-like domain-containing protein n=1 Tax=Penicillium chrysogenum TaxID=5076 RepID=A0ABQ8W5X8_PENCH|nr:uncharacterized protein N7489_007223 [Penicillium chrysogenum]KAJ5237132.1 hypothetical protein N7489_007223 [Penicillium chrysogenum]KAJ5256067.1 hypothetical protein N7505_011218 [Penicillium chrysogenum]KAJ5277091.1 hypothetical protein N7524_003244 [Penicillium chrysogenum]KAJ6152163.1 hypothetical protein N7497_006482 [Penicillium chrysogenum]